MFCPNCGEDLNEGATYCANCGYSLVKTRKEKRDSDDENISIRVLVESLKTIAAKPFTLWGLSLLCGLLEIIAIIMGGMVIGVGVAVGLVLNLGMAWVFLDGYRGEEVNSKQIFEPFYNFWHSFAGMGWQALWIFIWSLIPFAGIVMAIIKGYSYSMVPYLLREDPQKRPDEVLKDSMKMTDGFKGRMFVTDLIVYGSCVVLFIILCILSTIPSAEEVFAIITLIITVLVSLFLPLLTGLIKAAWYEELKSLKN